MLRKLREASVTEDLGEFGIRAIKITRESIHNIVLSPREPLGVFLDACFEEKGGMVACRFNSDSCLGWVGIIAREFTEVCLAEPSRQRGAVSHQEDSVPPM